MDVSQLIKESSSESSITLPICNSSKLNVLVEGQVSNNVCEIMVSPISSQSSEQTSDITAQPRIRRKKRPFSPDPIGGVLKVSMKTKVKKKCSPQHVKNHHIDKSQENLFMCDKCGSKNIVDPSRCRLPISQHKKIQTVRKKVDPITNKILNLCNACGLAFSRPQKEDKRATVSIEDRQAYLAEAETFAKSIAEKLNKPAAERLYCPAFKNRPCGCIQTHLSPNGEPRESTLEYKVENLLQLFNTACNLNRRKKLFPDYEATEQKSKEDMSTNPNERKQRQKEYEQFILDTRKLLREKLRLCERACQRILLYSNNFLHKRLKSAPNQGSRVSRQLGRNSLGQLKPIDELGSLSCCADRCSRLALTHTALLEEWRKQACLGQRQARRVLAEMLTPSGGTKANCYKFISMVTGCGPTTISSVSHQMRATKGIREPPEHGLKKWYRDNPRKPSTSLTGQQDLSSSCAGHPEPIKLQDPKFQLEQQEELEEAKRQLYLKQQELDHCRQIIDQHFLQASASGSHPFSKVDVIKSTLRDTISGTDSINLPLESNVTMMSEFSSGQSVQIIDLIPGTYIAVPSSFDSSTILTVAPDSKQAETNSMQHHQEIYPDNLQLPSGLLIHSENGVQTIINISAETEEVVGTILEEHESDLQSTGNSGQGAFVMSSVCDASNLSSLDQKHSNNTTRSTCGAQSLPMQHNSTVSLVDSHHILSSRTTVITPSNIDSEKSVSNPSTSESSTNYKDLKSAECMDGMHVPRSLTSVILLSSESSQPTDNSMNGFDKLFE